MADRLRQATLRRHLSDRTSFADFFADADLNPEVRPPHRIGLWRADPEVEDPLMRQIRYLDKLVDDLAKASRWPKVLPA